MLWTAFCGAIFLRLFVLPVAWFGLISPVPPLAIDGNHDEQISLRLLDSTGDDAQALFVPCSMY